MTHSFQIERLTRRPFYVLGILTALTLVSSASLVIGFRLLGGGANIVTTASASATSPGAALQAQDPFAPCVPAAANAIACENSKPGNPASEWDITGAGDGNIQGFATDISVNRGETVRFKINTNSNNYRLDIYRLGYYGGLGARLIATVQPSATLPQAQPACLTQPSTGLIDCGNWAESASWAVPSNATSGIYVAKLVREDSVPGSSHIVFIVRDDSGASDILFQTSDTTWQAYNSYGGNSLYIGSPDGRAYKVSYNRPFNTRAGVTSHDWLFDAEYPMVRWLEANGYDVSYFTGVDSDRRGAEILEHNVFLSVGHDEYWSGTQRANVEAARNAGVHLGFFSGNIMFWKTRWESSIDGSGTQFRTLVCYKETHANAKIDPLPNVWTGTWRDPRFSPPADGGRPENALIGTIFAVNGPAFDAIKVPEAMGKFRFWRNTTVATQAPGQIATVGSGAVGYEWDEYLNNGFNPSGLIRLSTNTVNVSSYLLDYGSTYGLGTATHSLTLYRHSSGALVFSAGTIRWSWGLDNNHDQSEAPAIPPPDIRMRQATVNLLADMGVQPATLQPGLIPATQSTDTLAPASTITSPIAGGAVEIGTPVNITGTASDAGGGLVAGVSVSVGGGAWNPATGTGSWSYNWTPTSLGPVTIRSRAVDDSGNEQNPPTEITITVVPPSSPTCPCSVWGSGAAPANPISGDGDAVEVGLKFRSDIDGYITGVRFYKGGAANGGQHVGHLWTSNGTLLGSVNFINESASGWQQALFQAPIQITANTTYVVSYFAPQGNYAADSGYFATSGVDNAPLHALSDAIAGGNGVYRYGPTGGFPTDTYQSSNYWVDVVFTITPPGPDTTPPTVASFTPAAGANNVSVGANVTVAFSEAMNAATINGSTIELRDPSNALVPATVSYDTTSFTATLDPTVTLAVGTTYTARVRGGGADPRVKDVAGNALAADVTWSFTTGAAPTCPCSIWGSGAAPANPISGDGDAVEVGLKFRSDIDGYITGVRFYKGGAANGGQHVGHLWTSSGTLLGSVNFVNESASGWQQALFQAPIQITANTTYVVSYFAPQGNYAADSGYFATSGVDNAPLHALSDAIAGGNGVYRYGPTGGFPTDTYQSSNYWVDVVFTTSTGGPDTTPPTVASFTPAAGANNVSVGANVVVAFSEAMNAATINGSTIELRDPSNALVPATVSYDTTSFTATLDPTVTLAAGTTYTARVRGGGADPRVKDVAGNALAADVTWSFTTGAAPTCPCSIWGSGAAPANPISGDGDAVELGLKFRSNIDGYVTGVRFYKGGAANGGQHVGHLWTSNGTLLGSVNFVNESASGWQQALFQAPIQITANTTYVVSYFAPQGNYAADSGYFATSGVDNEPLGALSSAVAGGNGVYRYDTTGGFPTDTYQATNYWVDVVFEGSSPSPPQVVSVTPAPGATGIATSVAPTATFSEALNSASLNASTVLLRDAANNPVPVAISYEPSSFTVTLAPSQQLQPGQTYTVTLKGGATAPHITGALGTPLASDYAWSFTTAPLPPPLPILVITTAGNKFTQYYQEILRAEGFNNFNAIDIAHITDAVLAQYDVAILGQMPLSSAQVTMLGNWVASGGNLIAMRPDKQLASLLGINDAASVRSDAYLLIDTSQQPGAGIVNQTIQYHGVADLYTLAGATQVAAIYSGPTQSTSNPAVTLRSVGTNGGQAAAFTFDLARSIVYTRQGNPAWAGQERDGEAPIRPNDLFYPDYVNLDKAAIPQADELQRLLANMILFMNADRRPLPRFWYLPNMKKAVIMMTGDDHGTDAGTKTTFDRLIAESAPGCSVADWECYRATSWVYTSVGLTDAQALAYHNQGFEVGSHVNTNCQNWTPQTLDSFFANDLASFAAAYPSLPAQKTNRTHCIPWSDWATQPKVELSHGVRLDENYYYWPSSWVQNQPGFMTGSGFPMRFADLDGSIIDVYQAATHLVNDNGVTYPDGINSMLDKALGPEGYYGVFGTHYDYSDAFDTQLLNSAKARGVSLISAQQLLTWLDGRNSSSFGNPTWNGTQLGFSITVGVGANNLYAMIPNQTTGGQLNSITINGSPVAFTVETIKGRSYAVFRAANGNVVATYAP